MKTPTQSVQFESKVSLSMTEEGVLMLMEEKNGMPAPKLCPYQEPKEVATIGRVGKEKVSMPCSDVCALFKKSVRVFKDADGKDENVPIVVLGCTGGMTYEINTVPAPESNSSIHIA